MACLMSCRTAAASARTLPLLYSYHHADYKLDSLCLFRSYPDGTVYDGEWVANVRCGRAMVTHANGSIFNGSYENDVACGEGSFTYPGGQIEVKGSWLQGQLHGEVRVSMTAR
jgi:hypothetical protein